MDALSFLISGPMVYLALAVFFAGMTYRVYSWYSTPKANIRLGMFPQPTTGFGKTMKTVTDSIFFPQVLDVEPMMWTTAIVFHIAGLMIFFGHLRLIQEVTPLVNALGKENMDTLALVTGGGFGIIITVAALYLLFRRFKTPYKELSVPEDYLLLVLILLVITLGNHLRLTSHLDVSVYRDYVQSILLFRPSFDAALAGSSAKWSLLIHVFLANVLLMYFPFSKLTHMIGAFIINRRRSD